MAKQLFDLLLHKLSRHSNREVPWSNGIITPTVFPVQITSLVGTTVSLRYRDHNKLNTSDFRRIRTANRPNDDTDFIPASTGPEDYDYDINDILTANFKILRADNAEPYVFIGVSEDYTAIIVSSTKQVNGDYIFRTQVEEYPGQINELVGISVHDQYVGTTSEVTNAVTLRVDSGEPCHSVIMEKVNNKCRFILGQEAMSNLYGYSVINIVKDKLEGQRELTTDVTGLYTDLYYDDVLSDEQIAEFRQEILSNITLYK